MKNNAAIIGAIVLIAITAVLINFSNVSVPKKDSINYDAFAKCLTENNAVFYGASWCSHCQNQKKLFGSSVSLLKYIECSTPDGNSQTEICRKEGINGYPTWKFNGRAVEGELDFPQLSQYSGCSLDLIRN